MRRSVMTMSEIGATLVGMLFSPWLEIAALAVGFFLALYYDWK